MNEMETNEERAFGEEALIDYGLYKHLYRYASPGHPKVTSSTVTNTTENIPPSRKWNRRKIRIRHYERRWDEASSVLAVFIETFETRDWWG